MQTVLPSAVYSESLAHCHEPGNGFLLLPLDEAQFILASCQQEKLKKVVPACAPAWLQSTLLLCLRQPCWFPTAGRSSLSHRTSAAASAPQGQSPLLPKGENLKGQCHTDGDRALTAGNSAAAATLA